MQVKHIDSLTIPLEFVEMMTEDVREHLESFMESHLDFIRSYCPEGYENQAGIHHNLLAIVDNKVIGIRYFYYSTDKKECELFNLYVDSMYRCKGIATILIQKSISMAIEQGSVVFTVRMAGENEERQALVDKYAEIVKEYVPTVKFIIYYGGEMLVY